VEPSHLIIIGVIGTVIFSLIAIGGLAWQKVRSPANSASLASTPLLQTSEPFAPQLATSHFDLASLTSARKDEFYRAIHSVDNLGVNFSRKVSIVAEEGGALFARTLVDLLVAASWTPEDHGSNGEYVGAPNGYRLLPGVTISAPVPSGAAEAMRVAFEKIGIPTRRKTDRSRTDDYLVIEIGPPQ
jgi:hypothetical protein